MSIRSHFPKVLRSFSGSDWIYTIKQTFKSMGQPHRSPLRDKDSNYGILRYILRSKYRIYYGILIHSTAHFNVYNQELIHLIYLILVYIFFDQGRSVQNWPSWSGHSKLFYISKDVKTFEFSRQINKNQNLLEHESLN